MAFTENISLVRWRKILPELVLLLLHIAAPSKGDILDLTLVTNHPVLDPPNTNNQFIAAYLGDEDANLRDSITFDRIVKTADSSRFPEATTIDEEPGVTKRQFSESNGNITTGVFSATVQREGTTYSASIPILLRHSTILPEQTTLTAHTGDTVSLGIQTGLMDPDLRWRFNGDGIFDSRNKYTLTLQNVGLNQSGVYKCFLGGNRWLPDQQAIMILHIIRCPAGRWGPSCEYICSECLNGGKCDADSGGCVCPPGFNGTTCEHVLGSNRFGQDGSFSCDPSGDNHGPGCRGKLFCLPDPFGCTCASGFMGINCTKECNPGMYGANCLQECHCYPSNTCAKDTGICIDGTECEEGWAGVNCQVRSSCSHERDQAPAGIVGLQTPSSATQIEVSWQSDTTPCPPDYYIIRYSLYQRLACPLPETITTEVEVNTTSPQHNNLADLMEPYSRYRISVVAVNEVGRSEPVITYASTLSGPPSTITNVRIDQERTSATSIGFTWQPLTCRNVNGLFRYYYTRIYKDGDRSVDPVQRRYYNNQTSSSVGFDNLEPCTMYELYINAVSSLVAGTVSRASGVTGVSFTNAYTYALVNQPNSLIVSWTVPPQCNVGYYKLSYQLISRKACPDVHVTDAPLYELNVTSILTVKSLDNLEYYSTYAISITAVIRGAESLPRNVIGDTADGVPSPLQSVSYTSTDESLHFMWGELSCENWHGIFRGYDYELYNTSDGRTISSAFSTLVKVAEIYNLDACTRYRFSVRVVTASNRRSAWHMEEVFTNISAPGMPSITQLTQLQDGVDATGLIVSWQPPTWPRCQPTHYEIKYYLRQGDSCEDIPGDPQLMLAGVVDGSNFTFQIDNLRPYSEYMVFVRGNTTSGYGNWDSRAGKTGYSYPSGPPINVSSSVTKKRKIVFSWEKPECGNRNGPITGYDVILYNSTGFVVHQENVTIAQRLGYEISDLTPYSNYSIRIRAWNYELAGVYSQGVWAQTDETRPGPPIGVILPSSDLESITVEWMSPNPPLGRIIGYHILYWETDAADTTPRNISIPCRDGHCSDNNYRFSEIIPDLQSERNYSIQVQAETILGTGALSPSEPAVTITAEGFPSNPQDLAIHSRSKSSFMITWMPPKYPRGRIISYTLAYKVKGKPYDSSFLPGDSFTMKDINGSETSFLLESLEPATLYEVYVTASTSKGEGESSAHVEEYSSPTPGCFDACSKICRCSDGVSDCDVVTGECSSGRCMNGWSGSNCQIASPSLSEPPSAVYTSCDTIAVIWKVWNGDHDSGEGPIGGYDIYLKTKTSDWAKFDFVIQDNLSSDILRYVLNDLEPDVEYTISVSPVHIDDIGKSRAYDGRGEEVMIRTVKCEPKSLPWAGIVSGITFFFLVICGGLFIGKWVYGRRASMNAQQRRASRPLPPVKKDTASFSHDLYENPTFSGLSKDDHIYTGLYEDIKSSDRTTLRSEQKHEYEKCGNPPSTVIYEYEDVKSPSNDEEHEYEISVDPPNRVLYENRDVKVISLSN